MNQSLTRRQVLFFFSSRDTHTTWNCGDLKEEEEKERRRSSFCFFFCNLYNVCKKMEGARESVCRLGPSQQKKIKRIKLKKKKKRIAIFFFLHHTQRFPTARQTCKRKINLLPKFLFFASFYLLSNIITTYQNVCVRAQSRVNRNQIVD